MPLPTDIQSIIDVITQNNLSNLTAPTPTLVIPAGLEAIYITTILNNLNDDLGLPADIEQLVKTLISTNQVTIITI